MSTKVQTYSPCRHVASSERKHSGPEPVRQGHVGHFLPPRLGASSSDLRGTKEEMYALAVIQSAQSMSDIV
jgi:hypothetical protein